MGRRKHLKENKKMGKMGKNGGKMGEKWEKMGKKGGKKTRENSHPYADLSPNSRVEFSFSPSQF